MSRRLLFAGSWSPAVASSVFTAALALLAAPVRAQPPVVGGLPTGATVAAPNTGQPAASIAAAAPRVEGTITFEQSGVTRTATMQFEAPAKLRITLAPDEASGSAAQTLVADGDSALLLSEGTQRVLGYDFNPARRPWRDANLLGGGPANIALFGLAADALNTDYATSNKVGALTLTARPGVGQQYTREDVRFGGTGKSAFYAAYKRANFNRPTTIELALTNGQVQSRIERDVEGQEVGRAVFTYNGALPREVTIQTPGGKPLARYTYDLKVREAAFPAATFTVDAPEGVVVEASAPTPALLARGEGASPTETYNRGVVRWRLTEDYRAASTDWAAASQAQPNATGPLFALCDAALIARDAAQAGRSLENLRRVLGENNVEVALRRVQLANLSRDWAAGQAALQPALGAHPKALPLLLASVENARARGDFASAAQALRTVLQVPNLTPSVYYAAAQTLQYLGDDNAEGLLKGEALTRWKARTAERGGDFDGALTLWKSLEDSAAFGAEADSHEMAIYADKGAIPESLQAWLALEEHASTKADRDRARVALLNAWRKANRQSTLDSVLTNRANAAGATQEDVRLWLNFQQINGNAQGAVQAIQRGASKFPQEASWQSLLSEALIGVNPTDALEAVNKAIALEPQQPFYRVQKALILRGPADRITATNQQRAIFENAVALIARDFPDDPDAQLSVALAQSSPSVGQINSALPRIQRALTQGETNDPSRHGFLLAARQGLASLYRQLDGAGADPTAGQKAETQYKTLMNAARSAIEEAAVASNYMVLIRSRKDPGAAASLLINLADETWQQSAWRSLVTAGVRSLVAEPELAKGTLAALRARNSVQANLAAAVLSGSLLEVAQAAAEAPKAGDKALDAVRFAQEDDAKSVAALDAPAPTPLLRGRAQGLKGESVQATDAAAGAAALGVTVQTEPFDVTTRLNLVKNLIASDQTEAAKAQRTVTLRTLPEDYSRLQNAVAFALQFGENEAAKTIAYAAMNTAQLDPDATPADYETAALMAARAAFATGDAQRGAALYTRLSDTQWAIEDRLAALLDWYNRGDADTQKRITDQVNALKPTPDQLASARNLSASLD